MPIQFACQCGKSLRAAEEHAGKRAKCSQCGQIVAIPAAKQQAAKPAPLATPPVASAPMKLAPVAVQKLAPVAALKVAPAAVPKAVPAAAPKADLDDFLSTELAAAKPTSPRFCPGCQQPLSSAAVVCVKCGYNQKTGQKMNALAYAHASPGNVEKRKRRRSSGIGSFFASRLGSGKFMSGLAMRIGATVWFFVGLHLGWIFFYPPILFIVGAISLITGLVDGDNA